MDPLLAPTKLRQMIREAYPAGARVQLVFTDDEYTKLMPGDEGEIDWVDDAGTVHVKWDNGSYLGMVVRERDIIWVIEPPKGGGAA